MTAAVGSAGIPFAAVPFLSAWNPSAKAKAVGAPVKVDISKIQPFLRTNDVHDLRTPRERIQSNVIGILPVKVVTFLSKFISH